NYNAATLPGAFTQVLAGDATTIKAQHFFFANGQHVGSFGQLKDSGGQFKANFDVSYTSVADGAAPSQPMQVVTQTGDTLRIIAGRIYGDSSLWYLIAEENGYSQADDVLTQGIILRIPNVVAPVSNNAGTFKPFNPNDAIVNQSPTQIAYSPPLYKKGCGPFGVFIVLVVAI